MSEATDEQIQNLAEASLRLARAIISMTDDGAAENFGRALFECPDGFGEEVAERLRAICPPEELQAAAAALIEFERI